MTLRNAFEEIATDAKLELVRLLLNSIDTKISLNDDDRIRVSTKPGTYDLISQDITANGQSFPVNVETFSNIMFHCAAIITVVGHNVAFEGSLDSTNGTDGNWFGIQAVRSNANTIATSTGTLTGNPGYAYEASVNALRWIRLRATAHTSGTMRWFVQPGSYATEPIPANQVAAVTTVTANIGTSGITTYTDSSANLAASGVFTGTARDAGSTPGYSIFAVNANSDQAGTLYIQKSTDNTTWRTAKQVAITAGSAADIEIRVTTRYNRVYFVNGSTAQAAFLLTSSYHRI